MVGKIKFVSCLSMFASAVLFSACSTMEHVDEAPVEHVTVTAVPKSATNAYKEASALLASEKYQESLDRFLTLLRDEPVSRWTQSANLNVGRSLEGLERWSEAAERYRSVVASTQRAPRLQAMALYRLSFCYEALGDEQQVVAVLTDLIQRKKSLPVEIADAELPARLGAAYARVGGFDLATEFYRKAEVGIARLRQQAKGEIPEWLPSTLYFMGEMSRRQINWNDMNSILRPLARSQVYLLQSAEFDRAPWSEKAAKELIGVYRDLIQSIEVAPLPDDGDPLLAERTKQQQQWDRSALVLDTMAELRARALPKDAKPTGESVSEILSALAEVDKRIQALLLERPAGEGLTKEAISRRSGGGVARVVDAEPSDLERRFLESSKEALPKPPPKASEDPNL